MKNTKIAPSFYKDLIKRAWVLTRNNKWLWFFGLFSAVLVGAAGEYNLLWRSIEKVSDKAGIFYGLQNSFFAEGYFSEIFNRFANLQDYVGWGFWPILVVFLVLLVYVVWLILASGPAIIYAANKIDTKKKVGFSESFSNGRKYIWQSLVLNFIGKVLVWLVLFGVEVLLAYVFIQTGNFSWLAVYLIISFVILLPIAIIVSFVVKYALAFAVLRGEKTWSAFAKGWKLFFGNWLVSLELALIIFVIYFLIGLAITLVIIFLSIPFIVLMFFGAAFSSPFLFWFILVIDVIVFFTVVVLVGSMMANWQLSTWVLLFDHLLKGEASSGIIRWTEKPAGKKT